MNKISKLALVVGLNAGLVMTAGAAEMNWRMATPWSGGPWLERDAQMFADRVSELSNGEIAIEVYPGGTLGSALRVTNTVKSGVAQISHNYINYDYGTDPTTALLAGHSSGLTPEEFMLWMYEGGGVELYEEYRRDVFDVVAFPCAILGTEIFLHSNKPVRTLEDFQGLRLRTSGAWAEIASRLGASTVVMAGSDIYSSLERGVIDAAEWGSPEMNRPTGFQEVAQYVVIPGVHQSGGFLECQVNSNTWESLSEQQQQMLRLAGKMSVFETWLASSFADLDAYQELVDGPNEIIELDQSFIDAIYAETELWEDEYAAENEWFARVLESQRDFKNDMNNWSQYRLPIGVMGR
ncbi:MULTISPECIES: TRAP transporter substrate-binding protein DctP [Halomonadaceae]|jgi:TRAP-type mannitol/chloroaromatic compound transport system substrate-binding protein|uniref:TRAP transporter substrate-binding protein DctP n=1 Tax=Halomonadaceae TaxID=28256 RepID=UPI00030B74B9|nr:MULTISPECIES: TRAP transporter substrate-binding protein DctP [Halomonas]NGO88594.1 C4-dicarboxylate ABC transporter substrate-binding protein [Halomonas sp.]PJX15327.1 C4-dicarboxylate ABC transporter substrate-binding protein [Halomonas sp. 141]UDM06404.1 TRAP transporter substrate-binding protein DctP [Halomonas sp. NyZ770]